MERSTWSYSTDAFTRKNTFHVALFGFFPFLSGSLSCSLALRELLRGSARSIPFHHSAREVRFVQIRNALIPGEIRGAAQESKVRLSERGFARLFSSVYFPSELEFSPANLPPHRTDASGGVLWKWGCRWHFSKLERSRNAEIIDFPREITSAYPVIVFASNCRTIVSYVVPT